MADGAAGGTLHGGVRRAAGGRTGGVVSLGRGVVRHRKSPATFPVFSFIAQTCAVNEHTITVRRGQASEAVYTFPKLFTT
ncbi:hypothetical protein C882_2270 [Caenispirillum salinarum AK4]|uniref:Uncharacterized protein n=1 Tax=Caenispirillum salinarum AK4 TaxID=1238182 RepID=K9H7V0_9PROT|nr:hypothetical protein C882_2270 [Caenispirillum salinarum AK4]